MDNYFIVALIFIVSLAQCNEKPAEANPKMTALLGKILAKQQTAKNNQGTTALHPVDGMLDMGTDVTTYSSSDVNAPLKNRSNITPIQNGKDVLGYYALISCLECDPPKITTALYDANKHLIGQLYESHSARVSITNENFSIEKAQELIHCWRPELEYQVVHVTTNITTENT